MTKLQDIKQSFGGWEAVMFVNFALHHQKKWYKIHKWKKTVKNQLQNFSLPRTTIQLLRLSTVSPGHCKISTSSRTLFSLRHDPPIQSDPLEVQKEFWTSESAESARNQEIHKFASCSQTMRKGGNQKNQDWISCQNTCSRDHWFFRLRRPSGTMIFHCG